MSEVSKRMRTITFPNSQEPYLLRDERIPEFTDADKGKVLSVSEEGVELVDVMPSGGVVYTEGYRISASSGSVSANAATDLTDFIAAKTGDKVEMYSMTMPANTANVGVHFYAEDKTTKLLSMVGVGAFPHGDWTYSTHGDNVTMFVVPAWSELDSVAYMRLVASEINDRSAIVVTHTEKETAVPKELLLASTTDGSTKQFRITVNDTGVLTATEVV